MDYMNILNTIDKTDLFNILLVIDDMTKTNYILENSCRETFDSIFTKTLMLTVNPNGKINEEMGYFKSGYFKSNKSY